MDQRQKILSRVREAAEAVGNLLGSNRSNVPLEQYLDKTDVESITVALSLEPDQWNPSDLESILIIRDGLYDIRQKLRDTGDASEHSIDHFLSALDRLYADLERAMRELGKGDLAIARGHIDHFRTGHQVKADSIIPITNSLTQQASEVLTQTISSNRTYEINLIKIEGNVDISLIRSAKLNIKRLSASVFAIKLQLQQSVIFQGIFKFLNDNADRIVSELKKFVEAIKVSYETTKDLVADITKLAEIGGRFTKQVSAFIENLFTDPDPQEMIADLKLANYHSGPTLNCSAVLDSKNAVFAGYRGSYLLLERNSGQVISQKSPVSQSIICLANLGGNRVGFGTDDGFGIISAVGRDQGVLRSSYKERVVTLVATSWGGRNEAIVSGSRDGYLRRWSLSGNLSRISVGHTGGFTEQKIGRSVLKAVPFGENILVASGEDFFIYDDRFHELRKIRGHFKVSDYFVLDPSTIIACGDGNIASINLAGGQFSRILSANPNADYSCVSKIDDRIFCVGSRDGQLHVIDLISGAEIGAINLDISINGIETGRRRIIAYGGSKDRNNHCIAVVICEISSVSTLS